MIKRLLTKKSLVSATAVLIYLMAVNFIFHMVTGWQYGIFRDEFYYVSMSRHLDFGYVDITPIAVYIMALTRVLFGTSIYAIHVFPALAGSFVMLFAGLTTRKMGGGKFAQALTAVAVMLAPMYLSFAGFFSYDAFDQLMSSIVVFMLVKLLKGEFTYKTWILFGFIAGIGVMVKITFGIMLVAFVIGLLLTRQRRVLAGKWPWIAAAIALVCFVPYAVWQAQRGFPFLQYLSNYAVNRSAHAPPWEYFFYQVMVMNPVAIILWLGGLVLLFRKSGRMFRPFAWSFLFYFTLAAVLAIKYYALAGVMLPLLAYGSVCFERGYKKEPLDVAGPPDAGKQPEPHGKKRPSRVPRIVYMVALCLVGLFIAPASTPVLPVQDYIAYNNTFHFNETVKTEDTEIGSLPQHYADRMGWEELAQAVAKVYHSLPEEDRKDCAIFAGNYGEAGALGYYAQKYDIPVAISGHLSFYYWGYGDFTGKCVIVVGLPASEHGMLDQAFEEVTPGTVFHHDYIMPYENDLPIYVCKGLKIPLDQLWKSVQSFS